MQAGSGYSFKNSDVQDPESAENGPDPQPWTVAVYFCHQGVGQNLSSKYGVNLVRMTISLRAVNTISP